MGVTSSRSIYPISCDRKVYFREIKLVFKGKKSIIRERF